MNFTSYLKKLFILTLPLALLSFLSGKLEIFSSAQTFTWSSLVFFFLLSCGVYWMAGKGIEGSNNHRFVSMISASFTGKLLLCVIFILLYVVIFKVHGKPFFIIPFFIFYIAFTILEVVELLKLVNKLNKKP